jgi:hypothetical protein
MRNSDWTKLLRKIPKDEQAALLLGLSSGAEVAVQDFLRIDEDFLVARGRIGGTTDAGRVFCLPYDQLTFFMFTRDMVDDRMRAIFGELDVSMAERILKDDQESPHAAEPDPIPETASPEPAEPVTTRPDSSPNSLRDRLRARLGTSGSPDTRPSRSG